MGGVKRQVVEEQVFEKDGEDLVRREHSHNFYAIFEQTGSAFYFGEASSELDEDSNVIATTGSWLAATNGARPGFIMPETRLVGAATTKRSPLLTQRWTKHASRKLPMAARQESLILTSSA